MRKILKALSLVMVLVMCFTMVFTTAVSAEGATPTLTINSAAVKEGETVTITVDAANFGTVAGAHFVVALPAGLENVAVAESDYVYYNAEAGTVAFVMDAEWADGKCDGIADGTLVTITAKAAVGTYVVDFAETGKTTDFCDANLEKVDVTKVEGKVVVETAGPTVVDLVFQHTLSLKSNIQLAIVPKIKNTVFADCAEVYAICTQKTLNGSVYEDKSTKVYAESNGYFYYGGLIACEMNIPVYTVIYGCDENGNVLYKSNVDEYSVLQYAANQFAKASSTDKLKRLVADVLVYGGSAQNYFEYDHINNNVMNTGDVTTPNGVVNVAAMVEQWKTKEDPTMTKVASNSGAGTFDIRNYLSLKSAVEVGWVMDKSKIDSAIKSAGAENVELVVTYNSKEYTYKATDFTTYASSYYQVLFAEVIAFDFSADLSAVVKVNGEDLSTIRAYSIEAYCKGKFEDAKSSDTLKAITRAIVCYGKSTVAYFS